MPGLRSGQGRGQGTGGGARGPLYKRATGRKAGRGVGGSWARGAQAAGPEPGGSERAGGGAEDPVHWLGTPMGRSRVNAF